jgi:hypothetical protein
MRKLKWIVLISAAVGFYVLNRFARRWGATDNEVLESFPGDELITNPTVETTHAVTVKAPADAIWPWLVQAGYHRGGWYGDDLTENLFVNYFWRVIVPEEERADFWPSATRILPEFQNLETGDIIPDGPPGTAYFDVEELEPNRHMVLYSNTHLKSLATRFLKNTFLEPYGEFTWAFVMRDEQPGGTRLILRMRADYGPPLLRVLSWPFFMAGEALFTYQILHGIRKRVEGFRLKEEG